MREIDRCDGKACRYSGSEHVVSRRRIPPMVRAPKTADKMILPAKLSYDPVVSKLYSERGNILREARNCSTKQITATKSAVFQRTSLKRIRLPSVTSMPMP